MRDFVIRKSFVENAITAMPAWSTDERFQTKAEIVFELLKQETVTTPLVLPATLVEIKSLIFQYPEVSMSSSKPIVLSEELKNKVEVESGIRPVLPLPDLVSAPKMLVPLENEAVIPSIIEKLVIISDEIYKPESCASKGISNQDISLSCKMIC